MEMILILQTIDVAVVKRFGLGSCWVKIEL